MSKPVVFVLENGEYVELCALLKVAGPGLTGGEAKQAIVNEAVTVDGQIETRKKCKIRVGQTVALGEFVIKVEGGAREGT